MRLVRRHGMPVVLTVVLLLAACGPTGHVAHGREGSWTRAVDPDDRPTAVHV